MAEFSPENLVELALRKGATRADALVKEEEIRLFRLSSKGPLPLRLVRTLRGILRVQREGRLLSLSMTPSKDLKNRVEELCRRLLSSPALKDPPLPPLSQLALPATELSLFDETVPRLWSGEMESFFSEAKEGAYSLDGRIVSLSGEGEARVAQTSFATSLGHRASYGSTLTRVDLFAKAISGDREGVGTFHFHHRFWRGNERGETLGALTGQRAVDSLQSLPAPKGEHPLLLSPPAASSLFGFWMKSLLANTSLPLGSVVASPLISVTDSPLFPGGVRSRPFDDEGLYCRKTTLVEKGILKNRLTDSACAGRDALPFTASAWEEEGRMIVSPSNLSLQPGREEEAELLKGVGRGFWITGLSAEPLLGSLSSSSLWWAHGFWVEPGAPALPVEPFLLRLVPSPLLHGLVALGKEIDRNRSFTPAPALLMERGTNLGGLR